MFGFSGQSVGLVLCKSAGRILHMRLSTKHVTAVCFPYKHEEASVAVIRSCSSSLAFFCEPRFNLCMDFTSGY